MRAVVARLADVPEQQRTVLHSAIAADPPAAERGFAWLLEHFGLTSQGIYEAAMDLVGTKVARV